MDAFKVINRQDSKIYDFLGKEVSNFSVVILPYYTESKSLKDKISIILGVYLDGNVYYLKDNGEAGFIKLYSRGVLDKRQFIVFETNDSLILNQINLYLNKLYTQCKAKYTAWR